MLALAGTGGLKAHPHTWCMIFSCVNRGAPGRMRGLESLSLDVNSYSAQRLKGILVNPFP
jgi:hypothetical protein